MGPWVSLEQTMQHVSSSLLNATSAWMGLPFDMARHQYAKAVQAGFLPRSLLHSARFNRSLKTAERLILGPFSRTY